MHRSLPLGPLLLSIALFLVLAVGATSTAGAEDVELSRTASPEGARAYIIAPADGETVSSPVLVRFGLAGIGVAPAGVVNPKTGHHHLIIDAPTPDASAPIANDAQHRHFGGGQTEVSIELEAGTHTLQLLLGDHIHLPHDPPITSETITITVE